MIIIMIRMMIRIDMVVVINVDNNSKQIKVIITLIIMIMSILIISMYITKMKRILILNCVNIFLLNPSKN